MAKRDIDGEQEVVLSGREALIGIPLTGGDRTFAQYVADKDGFNEAATEEAVALIGAWHDLDWPSVAAELDRLRHESPPSPPVEV